MPEFNTITTFEKDNADLVPILWGIPEFIVLQQLCFGENSPYMSSFEWKNSEGNSYIELYINFHDEATYFAWYDEFGAIHDAYATILEKKLVEQGVVLKRYFDGTVLIDPVKSMFMADFVSKL
jgi:2-hydroxychromene-2-carboxylate isomerase